MHQDTMHLAAACQRHTIGHALIIAEQCPPSAHRAAHELSLIASSAICLLLILAIVDALVADGRGKP